MSIIRIILASTLFAAAALAASAATVEISGMAPTLTGNIVKKAVVIRLNEGETATALYDRINHAALVVCSSNPGGRTSLLTDKVEQCRAAAVRRAVREIGTPELIAAAH